MLVSPLLHAGKIDITPLSSIASVDLDGSQKLALLAFPGVHRDDSDHLVANGPTELYAYSGGQLVNGVDEGGGVASGRVSLNGDEVAKPSDFKLHVHRMSFPVALIKGRNSIAFELDGRPNAGIWV